jgi:hypothetical protein
MDDVMKQKCQGKLTRVVLHYSASVPMSKSLGCCVGLADLWDELMHCHYGVISFQIPKHDIYSI